MRSTIALLLSVFALSGCASKTMMFVDPKNPNRYGRCWAEGAGLDELAWVSRNYAACEDKAKALGMRSVVPGPAGGPSTGTMVVPVTIMRAPDGTEQRCEARTGAKFEVAATNLQRAAQAERECIERLKRQGYQPVWIFEPSEVK